MRTLHHLGAALQPLPLFAWADSRPSPSGAQHRWDWRVRTLARRHRITERHAAIVADHLGIPTSGAVR